MEAAPQMSASCHLPGASGSSMSVGRDASVLGRRRRNDRDALVVTELAQQSFLGLNTVVAW